MQLWISYADQNVISNAAFSNVDDSINPDNSVPNEASKCSGKSATSGKASTTSSRNKAEVEKAALLACIAALKDKHAFEEQEQQIRRKMEQQVLETMTAESAAKLAVLQTLITKVGLPQLMQ